MNNIFNRFDSEESFFNPDYTTENAEKSINLQPKTILSADEKTKLLNIENKLRKRIIGQNEAIATICNAIKRSRIGLRNPSRPIASFIFLGASGVGKTELCKVLAETLYGNKSNLIKLDMSEYASKWDIARLTGAAPGYIGYESDTQLINLIRQNPKGAVLCLDEIEKAHSDVFNVFLQILDDGCLTSSKGETVSFKDIIIIMTGNIGSDVITGNNDKPIGFAGNHDEETKQINKITAELKKVFKPEFLNRITSTVIFNALTEKDIVQICKIMLKDLKNKAKKIDIEINFDKTAISELSRLGYSREYNARELQRIITSKIEDQLTDMILTDKIVTKDNLYVSFNNDFIIEKKKAKISVGGAQ